jgi:feruloyl esterase
LWWRLAGGPGASPIADNTYKYIVFSNPQWDYHTLDFDRDLERALQIDRSTIDATDPDLEAFRARGGKLIQYHGWSDDLISPQNSIDYYENVLSYQRGGNRATKLARTQTFYRLFMVPGMTHCFPGGSGADYFDMVPEPTWCPSLKTGSRRARTGEGDCREIHRG